MMDVKADAFMRIPPHGLRSSRKGAEAEDTPAACPPPVAAQ